MKRVVTVLLMLGTLLAAGQPVAVAGDPDLGRLWAKDKILRDGCHNYRYQFRLTPGSNEWSLETFLRDPTGEFIASGVFDSEIEKKRDSGTFRFCRHNTQPGRFKIKGKLTIYDGYDQKVKWVKPGFFRMRLPS